jgi:preprotein translocase subunit YajC
MYSSLQTLIAAGETAQPQGLQQIIAMFGPWILIFVVMYLLMIRPQQKKAKDHREMLSRLKAGDRVVTNGGIHGQITAVNEKTVSVRVADKVELQIARAAVAMKTEAE